MIIFYFCVSFLAVCVGFLTKFVDELDSDTKSDPKKIEKAFRKKCKNTKKDDNRFVSINLQACMKVSWLGCQV